MDIDALAELNDSALVQYARFKVDHSISPERLMTHPFAVETLCWQAVPFGEDGIEQVPDDRRGIYAFSVYHENPILPRHGYVLYIGIAGRRSERSLRARYRDYFNERKIAERPGILRMIVTWSDVLKFCFAPIEDTISSEQLEELERQLVGAFMPPFSVGDVEADLKRARRAFP